MATSASLLGPAHAPTPYDPVAAVWHLISTDPGDTCSDIGKKIFDNLDFESAIAFSRVSKGLNQRCKQRWFTHKTRELVLRYIERGTKYRDYIKGGGWGDYVIVAAAALGVAITIASGVRAGVHSARIPKDAPTKTVTVTDEYNHEYEVTVIDHPEARCTEAWATTAALVGAVTVAGIVGRGIYVSLQNIDLDLFFTATQKDIIGDVKLNIFKRVISPNFNEWKAEMLKRNLSSNPPNWDTDPILSTMICPISGDFMYFPVVDSCGHHFDFRSLRAYQLNPTTARPLECPISTTKPNRGLAQIKFDKAQFDRIQSIINPPR